MKNDTKNIHLCFENLFINISEDKQDENAKLWTYARNSIQP